MFMIVPLLSWVEFLLPAAALHLAAASGDALVASHDRATSCRITGNK
jgi:hypothetical protein